MHFNPRAPCGARRSCASCREYPSRFQPTRPLRGATDILHRDPCIGRNISTHAPLAGRDLVLCGGDKGCLNYFNPRAPCGARPRWRSSALPSTDFNPRAPCGARRTHNGKHWQLETFQPTRPLRGATVAVPRLHAVDDLISTHAPLAGRDVILARFSNGDVISTHAPLAGRDLCAALASL